MLDITPGWKLIKYTYSRIDLGGTQTHIYKALCTALAKKWAFNKWKLLPSVTSRKIWVRVADAVFAPARSPYNGVSITSSFLECAFSLQESPHPELPGKLQLPSLLGWLMITSIQVSQSRVSLRAGWSQTSEITPLHNSFHCPIKLS